MGVGEGSKRACSRGYGKKKSWRSFLTFQSLIQAVHVSQVSDSSKTTQSTAQKAQSWRKKHSKEGRGRDRGSGGGTGSGSSGEHKKISENSHDGLPPGWAKGYDSEHR